MLSLLTLPTQLFSKAAYTANLASFFVTNNVFETAVRDIGDVIDQRLRVCVDAGSYSEELLREQYPDIAPYLVPVLFDDLYDALYDGDCEILIAYKQQFESNLLREKYNPDCTLEWQGRAIKTITDGFATKIDPGIKCTDLVKEVINYFLKEMEDNGYFYEAWKEHNEFYGTAEHCEPTSNEEGRRRRLRLEDSNDKAGKGKNNARYTYHRRLGAAVNSRGAAAGGAALATDQNSGGSEESGSLTLRQMAGTMLFQVVGSLVAVVFAMFGLLEKKTNVKRHSQKNCRLADINVDIIDTADINIDDTSDDVLRDQLHHLSKQLQIVNKTVSMMQESLDKRNRNSTHQQSRSMMKRTQQPRASAAVTTIVTPDDSTD